MASTLEELSAEVRRLRMPTLLRNLERLATPGVRILSAPEDDESRLAPGASKFWGRPDLPPSLEWPEAEGRPLSFLGQISMAEAAPFVEDQALPQAGLLYFFYDLARTPTGRDPAQAAQWRVLFHEGPGEGLERRELPRLSLPQEWEAGGDAPPDPVALSFVRKIFLPSPNDVDLLELGMQDDEYDRYLDWLDEEDEREAEVLRGDSRLLGRPFLIESDMRLDCQLAASGVDVSVEAGYEDPRAPELADGASDWRLLLQRDSDPDGVTFGDSGMIYFWIRHGALRNTRFDEAWCMLQSY